VVNAWEKEIPIWKPRIQEWLAANLMVSWFRDKSLSVVLIRDIRCLPAVAGNPWLML
jgi:hypothetical protein